MNFSTNQARQVYVAKAYKATAVVDTDAVGTISVHSNASGDGYFLHRGVDGVSRTDLIKKDRIEYAKATDADNLARPLKRVSLALDSNVNSGALVVGEDYIVRIAFRNYIGLSEEDQYFKYGAVHAVANMTAAQFYAKMALSLAKNFSREPSKLLKFYVATSGTETEVTADTLESSLSGSYTSIVIEEVEQEWSLGTFESLPVNFTVSPTTIELNNIEYVWGVVTSLTPQSFVANGKVSADLEYFLAGEKGDEYRNVGFPKVIKTTYLVDPSLKYNYIDIHFYWAGYNEAVQKSERDITIMIPKVGASNDVANALANDIISAINSAFGTNIADLDDSQ